MFARKRTRREVALEKLREAPGRVLERIRPEPPKPKRARVALAGIAGGAAAMFFLDPQRGRARRARARDRVRGLANRAGTRLARTGGKVSSDVYGLRQRLAHGAPESVDYNDATLARKVESELFLGRDVPSDRIVINAENGVVTLRGEVDRPEQIRELEKAAAKIAGVRGVQTLLHLPNTPPPNKAEAIQAS